MNENTTTTSDDALRLAAEMRADIEAACVARRNDLFRMPPMRDGRPQVGYRTRAMSRLDVAALRGAFDMGARFVLDSTVIDTLRRERDERADAVKAQAKCFSGLVAQAEATIAAQAAEIARKDAALKPFADAAPSSCIPDGVPVVMDGLGDECRVVITCGHLRAARGALQPAETPATVADAVIRDDLHEYCGSDAARWAEQFRLMAIKLGYSDMDEGWLIGWFANAIERSIQVRHPPTITQSGAGEMAEFKLAKRPVAFRITAPAETGWSWLYFRDEQKAAETAAELGCEYEGLYVRDGTPLVEPTLTQSGAGEPVGEALDADFADYDAGLLNDFGGGNVDWWWDYLRAEIGRANDFWRSQVDAALSPLPPQEPRHDR